MVGRAPEVRRAATHLAPVRRSPSAARHFVTEMLRRWHLDSAVEPTALLISELVTNAVVHAGTDVQIVLEAVDDTVHVEVIDLNRRLPVSRFAPYDDLQTGRGLTLLESVATAWGVAPLEHGKAVWFDVKAPAT
jgi:anti-sigma regulatory factor (Ser/Thr protein kinase)